MKIKKYFIIILALAFFLSSCQQAASPTAASVAIPTPESSKATVIGKVISLTDSKPITNTIIYLAQIYGKDGQSAFALDTAHSPASKTDAEGNFVFTNIAPNDYALIVGDPMDAYAIVPDEKDANKARVWTVEANKVLDLATIKITLK